METPITKETENKQIGVLFRIAVIKKMNQRVIELGLGDRSEYLRWLVFEDLKKEGLAAATQPRHSGVPHV